MAIAALEAGKDVFVEKPLALTAEDGRRMVESAHKSGKLLVVGHLLIHHPAVKVIQQLLRSGELGRLEYVYSNRLSMGKIRQEENALWSFAPHDISIILRLTGHMPMEVTAVGGTYLQPNIADVTVSNLLFERGIAGAYFRELAAPLQGTAAGDYRQQEDGGVRGFQAHRQADDLR